jgi:hypothetical protein
MNPNLALLIEAIITQARLDAPRDAAAAEWLALLDHPRYGTPPPLTPAAVRAARATSRLAVFSPIKKALTREDKY